MIYVFYSDEDEGYIALYPPMGVSAFGGSVEEAIAELRIARRLAEEVLAEIGSYIRVGP